MAISIIGLMALQAVLGLLLQGQYRDVPWIAATWFGNDWITLAVAGELPAWGLLAFLTAAATMLLLAGVREPART
jgi:hypothetical protein